jgi:hypothetical protein
VCVHTCVSALAFMCVHACILVRLHVHMLVRVRAQTPTFGVLRE